jgi:hypothetical protein
MTRRESAGVVAAGLKERDVVAIPLGGGGYGLGVVARWSSAQGRLWMYCFGEHLPVVPALSEVLPLHAGDALVSWAVLPPKSDEDVVLLGSLDSWDRDEWRPGAILAGSPRRETMFVRLWNDDEPVEEEAGVRMPSADAMALLAVGPGDFSARNGGSLTGWPGVVARLTRWITPGAVVESDAAVPTAREWWDLDAPEVGARVILRFALTGEDSSRDDEDLEQQLDLALTSAGVGGLDGHETGADDYGVFLYGADAEQMLAVSRRILRDTDLRSLRPIEALIAESNAPQRVVPFD